MINRFIHSGILKITLRDTFLLLAWCVLFAAAARGQDTSAVKEETVAIPDSTVIVDSIIFSGNEHTQNMVILREMSLKPGVYITMERIKYDQARIYSIGLFTEVELVPIPTTAGKANLRVTVHERWYIIPFPVFGIKDGDWNKAYYGLGLIHDNFRGRDEKLYFIGAIGYDPWGSISYRNPFLDSTGTYFFDGRISFNRVRNRSNAVLVNPTDQFDEQHFSTSVTIGKRLDNYNTISGFLEYDRVDITDYFPYPTVSPDGIDKFFTLGANFTHDTRDLAEYSANGSLVRGGITKYGFPGKKLDNIRYSFDVRGFVPLADGVVSASRVAGNLMAGSQSPSYNHVYIGYDYRVRGHIGETTEGESMFGTSTELRFNIIQPRYFRANFLPKAFGIWRFALEFAVFGDAAVTWFRKDPAALNNFLAGYGAGFDFLLPYSLVIRTEYARNESSRGQFILDLGGAF